MTIGGNAGITFNVTETSATTDTGTITQTHTISSAISSLTLSTSDLVCSMSGSVATNAFDINLNSIENLSGSGYDLNVQRNQELDFTTIKKIVFHNTSTSGNLIVAEGSSTSFLENPDSYTVEPGQAISLDYSTAKTVGSTGRINLVGTVSVDFKIYILGT